MIDGEFQYPNPREVDEANDSIDKSMAGAIRIWAYALTPTLRRPWRDDD